jgi:hypothetical protein
LFLWQHTRHKQLKGGRIYFDSPFQRFQSIDLSSVDSAEVEYHGDRRLYVRKEVLHLIVTRKQKGVGEKGLEQNAAATS